MDHPAQEGAGAPRQQVRHRRVGLAWGFPFVGSTKTTLRRVLREAGVGLAAEAQARLDALPEQFMDFIAAPEKFTAQPLPQAA